MLHSTLTLHWRHRRSLEWLCETCRTHIVPGDGNGVSTSGGGSVVQTEGSLLELHCGFAHSTVALSHYFTRVLGVELNRHLAAAAEHNLSEHPSSTQNQALPPPPPPLLRPMVRVARACTD